jgi:glycosyltransferase involved in cell wall biosynthesis
MKILFLADNFPPEANAPATRTYQHCRAWVRLGAQVTVITCAPNFPQGRVHTGYVNRPFSREYVDGIEVLRVWTYIAENSGFAKRILDYLSFAASSMVAGAFVRADVIVATSPQLFTALGGLGLGLGKRKPWVFELRDLWPDSIRAVSAMKNAWVLDWLEKLELFLYQQADLVVAVTPAFRRNLIDRGIAADKIEVVTNGVDLSMFQRRVPDQALLAQLGLTGKFVVGYVGTHGMAHNLEGLLAACDRIHDPDVAFVCIGDGARKRALREVVEQKQLRNVLLLDPVAKEEIVRYWSIVDVALVALRRDPVFTGVIPSKIFEAAAMGKPILLGVEGQAKELIEGYDAGVCFEPDNADAFLAGVDLLRRDRGVYDRLSRNCLILARDFERDALAEEMYRHLLKLVERAANADT